MVTWPKLRYSNLWLGHTSCQCEDFSNWPKNCIVRLWKTIQTAFREVNDALAVRENIGDRLAAQRRLVDATNTSYKLSTARFRAGIDNYLTVLDAQRTSYSAEQGLLLLEQANLNNQVEVYKTLGGGVKANTTDQVVKQPSSSEVKYNKTAN